MGARSSIYLRTVLAAVALGLLLIPGSASAVPTLGDVLNGSSWDNPVFDSVNDNNAESAVLTDVDGIGSHATAFLVVEFAGYAPYLTFGIYDYVLNPDSTVTLGDKLELFAGSNSPLTTRTVYFNFLTGEASANGATANIDQTFGFYLGVPNTGNTFYSHAGLNADGFDHAAFFDLVTDAYNYEDYILGSDLMIAFEDLYGGGDRDYNDFVVGISDVTSLEVSANPEPGTLILLSSGILGAGYYMRRKMRKTKMRKTRRSRSH